MESFAEYQHRLKVCAAKWIETSGLTPHSKAPFVLQSQTQWRQNLLLPELATILDELQRTRKESEAPPLLQRMPHSAISTQIMVFNLFLPLLARDDLDAIAGPFLRAGTPWPGPGVQAEFEVFDKELFREPYKRPVSADLVLSGANGPPIYVKAKLAESSFSPCQTMKNGDCEGAHPGNQIDRCPAQQSRMRYWDALNDTDTDLSNTGPMCPLGPAAEFFLLMTMALNDGGHFVLLTHDDNPAFVRNQDSRGWLPFLTSLLPEPKRKRVHVVTLRKVLTALQRTKRHKDWLGAFVERYGLDQEHLANREPEAISRLLGRFPEAEANEIREIWRGKILGAKGKYDLMATAGFQRIHTLLVSHGLSRQHREWLLMEEYGQSLYRMARPVRTPKK